MYVVLPYSNWGGTLYAIKSVGESKNSARTVDKIYRQTSIIRRTSVGNEIADHSDVVGASPVGAAPITSSFAT